MNKGEKINDYILRKEAELSKNVTVLQKDLLNLFTTEFINSLDTKDGKILKTSANFKKVYEIDNIFANFSKEFQSGVLKDFANSLLELVPLNEQYYNSVEGLNKKSVQNVANKTQWVADSIGIDKKGNIIKGSYLDSISQNAEVKNSVKQYTVNSINSGTGLKDYISGMKELIVGNKKVEGRLQKYYKQFAYDTFSQTEAAVSNFYADTLGLDYFIYSGGVITDTRKFCRDRNGKVFTRKEGEAFNELKPWAGAKTPLNFFLDRGGYNCRHQIRWISKELAYKLRPELKEKGL